MGIFSNKKKYATLTTTVKNEEVKQLENKGSNLWDKCTSCGEIIYKKDIKDNNYKCPKCHYYFRMSAMKRIALLIDEASFERYDENIEAYNVLNFPEYTERLKDAIEKTDLNDSVISGIGTMNGIKVSIAVMDFNFMGGSMGSVTGEIVTNTIERGIENNIPVIIVSSSGGARMQEGILSLMQMAKTSAALAKLRAKKLPYISVPVNPTTGGVTASFAMLGDVIITEPNTLIAFAGPRVIEQTIKQQLPEGFQKSEFLLEHGMIDIIAKREELKSKISNVLKILLKK